jgi:dipeptidyl aminopeptidase/acylaminoacyl peptidase
MKQIAVALLALALGGCSGAGTPSPSTPLAATMPPSAAPSRAAATAAPAPPFVQDAPTLRTIAAAPETKSTLSVGREIARFDAYVSHAATYTSDGLTISAVLLEPRSPGPHPGVVLVHGFVDPATYVSGGELQREQDALARAGYVVLYTDLRGLAGSDPAPAGPPDLDMGTVHDVLNAVRALASSGRPGLDAEHIGLLGHSLGGLLVIDALAAKPELVDAVVAFAPSSTIISKNLDYYLNPGDPAYDAVVLAHGTLDSNPGYWHDLSAGNFIGKTAPPLLVVHGDADQDSPYAWSQETVQIWKQAGAPITLLTLPGEDHVFEARWQEAMDAVTKFFAHHLS